MALANCPQCGKLFNKALRDVCPDCVRREEQQFMDVKEYLRKNKSAKPYEVSEATDVPVQTIYKFVREGRLQATYYDGLHYECENCKRPILSGKYCGECQSEITKNMTQLQQVMQQRDKNQNERIGYHYNVQKKG